MLIGNHMRAGVGNDSHAVLLVQSDAFNGDTNFADTSRGGSAHVVNGHGGVAHSTAQAKFGASSARITIDRWLALTAHADWNFGPGNWTAEVWVRLDATAACVIPIAQRNEPATDCAWVISLPDHGVFGGASQHGTSWLWVNGIAGLVAATWHHVAVQRQGNILSVYRDGVLQDTAAVIWSLNASALDLTIGRTASGTKRMTGYADEIRVTKGLARYPSAGFTVPNRMS